MDALAIQKQLESRLDAEGRALLDGLVQAYVALEQRLEKLERALFGPRSEKVEPVHSEVRRELNAAEVSIVANRLAADAGRDEPTKDDNAKARRVVGRANSEETRKKKRRSRVETLPIVTEVIEVLPENLPEGMTMEDFQPLGSSDVVVRWEMQRSYIVQIRYEMPKLQARANPAMIVHASAPPTPVRGGKYGTSFYVFVVIQRILNNMPLQRMASAWRREGVDIAPSVLVDWFHRSALLLTPVYKRLVEELQNATYVCADETWQPMQAPGSSKTHRGWMWMALCESVIVYHFATSRSTEAGRELLGDRVPHLMVDGYSGYNGLVAADGRSACWTHVRRSFWELREHWPEANAILEEIRGIYRVEIQTRARSEDPDTLQRARHREARPHVEAIFRIVESMAGQFSDSSAQAKAIGYVRRRQNELARFLDDPKIPLDNNISERALRIVATGRKNSLFVGPGNCGKSLAILLTVLRTCELRGVSSADYLFDALPRLAELIDRKDTDDDAKPLFNQLTPAAWQAARKTA